MSLFFGFVFIVFSIGLIAAYMMLRDWMEWSLEEHRKDQERYRQMAQSEFVNWDGSPIEYDKF